MEINEAYAIMSTRTGGMYLDDDSRCYICTDRKQAEEWSKKIKNTMVSQPRYFKIREMGQECYAYGADVIVL